MMDSLRELIKKKSHPIAVRALRSTMVMPASVAQSIIAGMTKPSKQEKRWIKKVNNKHWQGAWIAPNIHNCDETSALERVKNADIIIFNVHGGGFRVGHCAMYIGTFITWLTLLKEKYNVNSVIMSVEYGLAPKHMYPKPVLECVDAYTYLRHELGIPGKSIIMTGDSAGGALCLETLVRVCAPSMLPGVTGPDLTLSERPAGLVLVSPLVTPDSGSESWRQFEKTDMLGQKLKKIVLKEYLGMPKVNPKDLPILRLSKHLRDEFERFLARNVLVFVGDKEVMRDDIVEFTRSVQSKDSDINIKLIRENYAHDWYFVREMFSQKDRAMLAKYDELFADFVIKAVQPSSSSFSFSSTQSFSSLESQKTFSKYVAGGNKKQGVFVVP